MFKGVGAHELGYKNKCFCTYGLQKLTERFGYKNIQREWVTKTDREWVTKSVTKSVTKWVTKRVTKRVTKSPFFHNLQTFVF